MVVLTVWLSSPGCSHICDTEDLEVLIRCTNRMALGHYNRAIELKPNLAEAYEYRGVLLLRMAEKPLPKKISRR